MNKIKAKEIDKILVVMLGGIGNLILLIPALKALRSYFTDSKITLLLGEPGIHKIISGESLFDEIIVHDRRKAYSLKDKWQFILNMRNEKFNMAFVSSHTNAYKGGLFTFLLGISHRIGQNYKRGGLFYTSKVSITEDTHECDAAIDLLESIGVDVQEQNPTLTLAESEVAFAEQLLLKSNILKEDFVFGIHLGSGYRQTFKRWSKERFARVADYISRHFGAKIVFVGGPLESDLVGQTINLMSSSALNFSGKLSLRETAAIIKRCDLFLSNDSGVAHMAAAVKTPLIVLFGPTNENRIAPKGEDIHIIKKETQRLDDIEVEDVLRVVRNFIEKKSRKETV